MCLLNGDGIWRRWSDEKGGRGSSEGKKTKKNQNQNKEGKKKFKITKIK